MQLLIFLKGENCELDFDGCSLNLCATGQNCTDTPATENKLNPSLSAYTCSACPAGYHAQNNKCEGKCAQKEKHIKIYLTVFIKSLKIWKLVVLLPKNHCQFHFHQYYI